MGAIETEIFSGRGRLRRAELPCALRGLCIRFYQGSGNNTNAWLDERWTE